MTSRRPALALLPVAVIAASALSGGAAHASTMHWKTLVTFENAHLQACKTPTTSTGPWKIELRLNAQHANGKVEASATPYKGTKALSGAWSSGYIRPGHTSTTGTVKLPRGSAYNLSAGVGGGQSGNGGTFTAASIPAC